MDAESTFSRHNSYSYLLNENRRKIIALAKAISTFESSFTLPHPMFKRPKLDIKPDYTLTQKKK